LEDGRWHRWEEVAAAISRVMQRKPLAVRLPVVAARAVARLGGWWGSVTGRPVLLNPDRMRELLHPDWVCTGRRIREELGFVPRYDLEVGLRQTYDWYIAHRWL
jgi:nucleoside-diphosphate-sugar epimerase